MADTFTIGDRVRCKWGATWYDAVVAARFKGGAEYDVHFSADESVGRAKAAWLVHEGAAKAVKAAKATKTKSTAKKAKRGRGKSKAGAASSTNYWTNAG